MKNLRVILIDDEIDSLDGLAVELNLLYPDIEILAKIQNPEEAIGLVKELHPDLIFLDIGMPQMDGFEFLQALDDRNFDVVFVTAYDEYAIKAFEFNAAAYLLKPILENKLQQAVDKVLERLSPGLQEQQLNAILNHIENQREENLVNIALPIGDGYEFVNFNDISFLEADNNYSWVHLGSGTKHLICKTLKDMEEVIHRKQFFRVHKSYLININHVRQYLRTDGGQVLMSNGQRLPISRRKKDELKSALGV